MPKKKEEKEEKINAYCIWKWKKCISFIISVSNFYKAKSTKSLAFSLLIDMLNVLIEEAFAVFLNFGTLPLTFIVPVLGIKYWPVN